jgi:hypothetical protein
MLTTPNEYKVLVHRSYRNRVFDKVLRRDQIVRPAGGPGVYSSWTRSGLGRSVHCQFLSGGIVEELRDLRAESLPASATESSDRWLQYPAVRVDRPKSAPAFPTERRPATRLVGNKHATCPDLSDVLQLPDYVGHFHTSTPRYLSATSGVPSFLGP